MDATNQIGGICKRILQVEEMVQGRRGQYKEGEEGERCTRKKEGTQYRRVRTERGTDINTGRRT